MNHATELIEQGTKQFTNLQFTPAQNSFEKALKQDPRSTGARIGLARILFMKSEYEQSTHLLNEVLEIQPSNAEGLALKGVSSMQKKDWKEALTYLEKARQADSSLQMIYANLAKSYRKLGNLREAEVAAREGIKLNSENYQAHLQLSGILFETKRTKEGIKHVLEALRINPLYIRGYQLIAHMYQASGKIDHAIRIYKKGLKANPLAIPLREELAGVYAFKGDYQSAYRQAVAIALMRNSDADWLRVGICAVAIGKFEKAEKAFEKALEINPNNWGAHYNLGELYFTAKLYEKAVEQYMLSINKDGKNFQPYNGLGMLLLMVDKNAEEAKRCFAKALELSPGQKEPMLNLALACAESNESDAAKKIARATLQVAKPGDGVFEQAERLIVNL